MKKTTYLKNIFDSRLYQFIAFIYIILYIIYYVLYCIYIIYILYIYIMYYIVLYIWVFRSIKVTFFKLKVSCLFIFSQLTLTLNCYSDMHLTSLVPKWKTHLNPVMTQLIRDHSMKPCKLQVRDGAGTLATPPVMLKHKTVVYFPLPLKWSIIVCSEWPVGKNRITQEAVPQFAPQINSLVLTWHKSPMEVVNTGSLIKNFLDWKGYLFDHRQWAFGFLMYAVDFVVRFRERFVSVIEKVECDI